MKKIICTMLTAIMTLSMVACGGAKKTVTLTYEEAGMSCEYTMDAKGDAVKKITQVTTIDTSQFTSDILASLETTLEETKSIADGVDCVTYTVEQTETAYIETIILDVSSKDNIDEISDSGIMPLDVDNADYISLEKTTENMESAGFTVVE